MSNQSEKETDRQTDEKGEMMDYYRDIPYDKSRDEPRNFLNGVGTTNDSRYEVSAMSVNHPTKSLTRSGSSKERFPSTNFVIETLKEKHRMLEKKLGIVVSRQEGSISSCSNDLGMVQSMK